MPQRFSYALGRVKSDLKVGTMRQNELKSNLQFFANLSKTINFSKIKKTVDRNTTFLHCTKFWPKRIIRLLQNGPYAYVCMYVCIHIMRKTKLLPSNHLMLTCTIHSFENIFLVLNILAVKKPSVPTHILRRYIFIYIMISKFGKHNSLF